MQDAPIDLHASTLMSRMSTAALLIFNVGVFMGTLVALLRGQSWGEETFKWPAMMIHVALMGALSGSIHGIASLTAHAGKGDLESGWASFYVGRPFVGAAMAVVTALVLKGGLGGFDVKNDMALMGWAALAGLYSQPALDKLKELFDTLFRTRHTDKNRNPGQPGQTK